MVTQELTAASPASPASPAAPHPPPASQPPAGDHVKAHPSASSRPAKQPAGGRPGAKPPAGRQAAGGQTTGRPPAGGQPGKQAGKQGGGGQPAVPRQNSAGRTEPGLFARLLAEAGMSDTRFARQVNTRARLQRRVELGLARTTVGHWRRGMKPRDPMVAELAAAELSAVVGYPVPPSDLGWRGEAYERDDLGLAAADVPDDTVRILAGLSGRDARRRDLLHDGAAFTPTAFADPVLSSMTGVIRRISADIPAPPAGGTMIRDMTATFRRLDARFGSSEIRPQVVAFLHDRTRAAVDGPADTDTFSALAELAQFSGWLAQDGNRQALAQRYYIQALTLAEHADDVMMAGRVMAAMSDQVATMGNPRQSLSLARAAIDRAARRSAPPVQAMLQDRLAWALARNGDEAGCMRALAEMERVIAREPGDAPAWAGYYNSGDVAECQGHCLRLLGKGELAEQRLVEARDLQESARARTRAYAEADLALARLQRARPDLEGALEAAYRAVDLAGSVSSVRIVNKLAELDGAIAAFSGVVAAREWRSRASSVVARPAERTGGQTAAAV